MKKKITLLRDNNEFAELFLSRTKNTWRYEKHNSEVYTDAVGRILCYKNLYQITFNNPKFAVVNGEDVSSEEMMRNVCELISFNDNNLKLLQRLLDNDKSPFYKYSSYVMLNLQALVYIISTDMVSITEELLEKTNEVMKIIKKHNQEDNLENFLRVPSTINGYSEALDYIITMNELKIFAKKERQFLYALLDHEMLKVGLELSYYPNELPTPSKVYYYYYYYYLHIAAYSSIFPGMPKEDSARRFFTLVDNFEALSLCDIPKHITAEDKKLLDTLIKTYFGKFNKSLIRQVAVDEKDYQVASPFINEWAQIEDEKTVRKPRKTTTKTTKKKKAEPSIEVVSTSTESKE